MPFQKDIPYLLTSRRPSTKGRCQRRWWYVSGNSVLGSDYDILIVDWLHEAGDDAP